MPAVARDGDLCATGHLCDSFVAINGDTGAAYSVYANNLAVVGNGDSIPTHETYSDGDCIPHFGKTVTSGSTTVFVGGIGIARTGDSADGAGSISGGSPDVYAGG